MGAMRLLRNFLAGAVVGLVLMTPIFYHLPAARPQPASKSPLVRTTATPVVVKPAPPAQLVEQAPRPTPPVLLVEKAHPTKVASLPRTRPTPVEEPTPH